MFMYKRNCNISCVFEFNVITLSNKLHNLKTLNDIFIIAKRGMRVTFIQRKVPQTSREKREMCDKSTDNGHVDCFNRSVGIVSCPSSSGTSKTSDGRFTDQESIASDEKFSSNGKQNSSNRGVEMKVIGKVPSSKNQSAFYNSITQSRQSHFNMQIHPAMYLSNCFSQHVTSPYVFVRSLSDSSANNKKLHYMCFNSSQNDANVSSRSNRSMSTARHSNVLRVWKQTSLGKILDKKKNGGNRPGISFKIMSYNVLAQDLLVEHPHLYREHEQRALNWEHRWRLLLQEIKEHDCDIVCLQEVQFDHIEHYYNALKLLGYSSIYKQRLGIRTDGCAIYYKKNIFHLVEHIDVEYRQPNITLLDRDNVALIAKFAPKSNPSSEFVVATTHLLYNPKRLDVRLAQMQVLLTEIGRIAYKGHHNNSFAYVPIIITGDLNSTPDSALYEFVRTGNVKYEGLVLRRNVGTFGKVLLPSSLQITDSCQHYELWKHRKNKVKISRSDELKLIKLKNSYQSEVVLQETSSVEANFSTGTLSHPFSLKSVYSHTVNDDIEGTTYQHEWITVDYIFYSGTLDENKKFRDDKLKLLSQYSLPTSQKLARVRIPNFELGSDHLALLAKFKLEY